MRFSFHVVPFISKEQLVTIEETSDNTQPGEDTTGPPPSPTEPTSSPSTCADVNLLHPSPTVLTPTLSTSADVSLPPPSPTMDQVDTPQMEHPGRDKVDQLCIFLVSLDRKISTLTDEQAQRLVTLWEALDDSDKQKPKYAGRTSSNPLAGGFHSTRKRSGTNPSLDAAER